jgi:hypothetical protein
MVQNLDDNLHQFINAPENLRIGQHQYKIFCPKVPQVKEYNPHKL